MTLVHREDGLRPAIAPGEDRNASVRNKITQEDAQLRPAIAPGEDRNDELVTRTAARSELRPAIAPGEDRNHGPAGDSIDCVSGCARPSRRARIATFDPVA